jgi:hypothetical protein
MLDFCNFIRVLLAIMSGTFIITGTSMLITGGRLILDFDIIALNSVEFNFIIIIDYVSLTFMGVVTLIARCVGIETEKKPSLAHMGWSAGFAI